MGFAFAFALIGLAMIYFEFFLPGGILGVIGGCALLGGVFTLLWTEQSGGVIAVYFVVTITLLILTVKFALSRVKKKPAFYPCDDQEGFIASIHDRELIGQEGVAKTSLRPSGHIVINGEHYQGVSDNGYIEKGETIKIVGAEGARYKVRKK